MPGSDIKFYTIPGKQEKSLRFVLLISIIYRYIYVYTTILYIQLQKR